MKSPRILAFAGSARRGSLNKQLVRSAAEVARSLGADVTLIDLDEFPMPLYHGDLEEREGLPEHCKHLKQLFIDHDALLLASPENNASVSSLMKNTLDWVSRQDGNQSGLAPYTGKVALLLSASPGGLGGLRGLVHLRQILQTLNVLVLPEQFALAHAHEAFDENGSLKEAKQQETVTKLVERLITVSRKMLSP